MRDMPLVLLCEYAEEAQAAVDKAAEAGAQVVSLVPAIRAVISEQESLELLIDAGIDDELPPGFSIGELWPYLRDVAQARHQLGLPVDAAEVLDAAQEILARRG